MSTMPMNTTGLLSPDLFSNPALQFGLGILANNRGNYGSFGAAVGQGGMMGMQNLQRAKMQEVLQKQQQMQMDEMQRRIKEQQDAREAQARLLGGREGYITEQDQPFTRTENVPTPAQEGAQAPNFNLTQQTITGVNKVPTFDNKRYMSDMVAAGFGDDLIKQSIAPKKVAYRDVGGSLVPYDEATGMPRDDLQPISKSLTPDAQANVMMRNYEFNNLSASQRASNDLTARGQNITMRGQNLTDARAREANAINAGGGKPPQGYRWGADGVSLEAIPGGPADKRTNLTEGQAKANLFGSRAAEADAILNGIGTNYSKVGVSAKSKLGDVANPFLSPNTQKVDQAQRNFINAVLRTESGAVIADSEFENARKQYFPEIGDSPEVIAQKAENRRTAIEGLNAMAGSSRNNRQELMPKNEQMPSQALPMPAKPNALTLKKGAIYNTPKGNLRWNGKGFEDL